MTGARRMGAALVILIALAALGAPFLATNPPQAQFADLAYAPPNFPRIRDAEGRFRPPFLYPLRLVDRLERRFEPDETKPIPLRWFAGGTLVAANTEALWLPLGGDALGRDVYSRLLFGARLSLGVATAAAFGALLLGALVGATAGYAGGRIETLMMALTDFVLVLPAIFVVLALRAAMPLVLTPGQVFAATTGVFALAGWPFAARGVRAIVAVERRREYAESARAAGASGWRILRHHLLPAARGFLLVQGALLLPAFIVAEATLSYVGLGFAEPAASWGGLLRDAGGGFVDAPWLLAPAGAIALTMFGLQLAAGADGGVPARSEEQPETDPHN